MKALLIKLLTLLGFVEAGNLIQEGQPAYNFNLLNEEGKPVRGCSKNTTPLTHKSFKVKI
jgi:hypothetical protein